MVRWNEIFTDYILGENQVALAEKYNLSIEKINAKIRSEKWAAKRKKICDSVLDNFEKRLEGLTKKAFEQLEDILCDELASSTSKIQAAKTIIDLAGLKKDKKDSEKEITFEVFINRKSVACR